MSQENWKWKEEWGEKPKALIHLHRLPEDVRIGVIGNVVMLDRKQVAVFVDDKPKEKVLRYRTKLTNRFPGIVLGPTYPGTKGSVVFKASPPPQSQQTAPGVN